MRAKVHRELLAEEEEKRRRWGPVVSSIIRLFTGETACKCYSICLMESLPSFLPSSTSYAFRSVDIPRLLSSYARCAPFPLSLSPIRPATPFVDVPFHGPPDTAAFPSPFRSVSTYLSLFLARNMFPRVCFHLNST